MMHKNTDRRRKKIAPIVVTVLVILVKRIRRRKPVKSFPRKADKEPKPETEE